MRKVLIAAVILVALTGCVPQVHVTPVPTPSGTPLFASDADALKAATDAYAKYLEVAETILNDGGVDTGPIDAVATGDAEKSLVKTADQMRSAGESYVGYTAIANPVLEQYQRTSTDGLDVVAIYVCLDVSAVFVRDASGASLVSPDRSDHQPFEVSLDYVNGALKVATEQVWSGKGVCES